MLRTKFGKNILKRVVDPVRSINKHGSMFDYYYYLLSGCRSYQIVDEKLFDNERYCSVEFMLY
jgi:hypothetical protein